MLEVVEVEDSWDAPDADRIRQILAPINQGWWVAAGLAIDLFVGRQTREHHDADVAIFRTGAEEFGEALRSWEIGVAVGWTGLPGQSRRILERWERGTPLPANAEAMWCRPSGQERFVFELLLNDGDETTWYFKRYHGITLPLDRFGMADSEGLPFVAPEVVLLHKATSTAFDEQDSNDFRVALPEMGKAQRGWLRDSLGHFDAEHPWMKSL